MQEKKFSELGIQENLLAAILELGFETPTPVQQQAIPAILTTESDLLALAQTGTGKTAAFGLPVLQLLRDDYKGPQAIMICPTRELCMQIERDLRKFSAKSKPVGIVAVYGGASISNQIKDLRANPRIIVATPGRLMDLMDRKVIDLTKIRFVVLDEADEMLNMGFREDIEHILSFTPAEKRVFLFSATMPAEVRRIADRYLKSPVEVTVGKKNTTNVNIAHQYAVVQAKDKYAALKRVLDYNQDDFFGIVFCTTKIETQDISDKLIRDGYTADCLHGDLSQAQREKTMHRFRHHAFKILLATDVAARGIDVKDLTHVIHYHLPDEIENYTHRSGRTARAGKTGISLALLNIREAFKIRQIERMSNLKFERVLIPTMENVAEKKVKNFIEKISGEHLTTGPYAKLIAEILPAFDDMSKEEVITRFLSNEFKKFKVETEGYNDLNVNEKDGRIIESMPAAGIRMFINLGSKDGLNNGSMKDLIVSITGIESKKIERIDVKGVYSFINLDETVVQLVMDALNGSEFRGRSIRMEKTGDEAPERPSSGRGDRRGSFGSRDGGGGERRPFYKGGERSSGRSGGAGRDGGSRDGGSRGSRDGGSRDGGSRDGGAGRGGFRDSGSRSSGRGGGAGSGPRRDGGNRTGGRR